MNYNEMKKKKRNLSKTKTKSKNGIKENLKRKNIVPLQLHLSNFLLYMHLF